MKTKKDIVAIKDETIAIKDNIIADEKAKKEKAETKLVETEKALEKANLDLADAKKELVVTKAKLEEAEKIAEANEDTLGDKFVKIGGYLGFAGALINTFVKSEAFGTFLELFGQFLDLF